MSEVTERTRTQEPTSREERELERARQVLLRPAADIFEHGEGITLVLDMPGVSKDRLNVQTDQNNLIIEGEAELEMPEGMEPLYADVRSTQYRRTFSLSGEQLDTSAIQAQLKDGVLRLSIPKRAEHRPRKIEVQAG